MFLYELSDLLIPISVCVVLPVMIVWLVCRVINTKINRRADIISEIIKIKPDVNVDEIIKSLADRPIPAERLLHLRLLRGCIFTLVGIAISGFFSHFWTLYDRGGNSLLMSFPGYVCLAIGIAYLIVYFVTRKSADKDNSDN